MCPTGSMTLVKTSHNMINKTNLHGVTEFQRFNTIEFIVLKYTGCWEKFFRTLGLFSLLVAMRGK